MAASDAPDGSSTFEVRLSVGGASTGVGPGARSVSAAGRSGLEVERDHACASVWPTADDGLVAVQPMGPRVGSRTQPATAAAESANAAVTGSRWRFMAVFDVHAGCRARAQRGHAVHRRGATFGLMAIRVVRLGQPRHAHEGLRIGTVRRPPRGVARERLASGDWYDVWFPDLSPSAAAVKMARSATTDRAWAAFVRRFRSEMAQPTPRRALDLLAALSHVADFSIGCYCPDEAHCHRGVLRELLAERRAAMEARRPPTAGDTAS